MQALRVLSLSLIASLALSATASGAIQIFKIQYDSPGRDTGTNKSLNGEWVQIRNTDKKAVSLTRWTLRDSSKHVYRFGTFTLRPGASVKVHTGKARDTRLHVYWASDGYVGNNSGREVATLKRPNGKTIDRCLYRGPPAGFVACKTA